MRYSFDTIDIKSIYDNIKTLETSRWTFVFENHSSNECTKKEIVDIDKKFNCVSHKLLMYPIEDNHCER